jgi:hypothetical protein
VARTGCVRRVHHVDLEGGAPVDTAAAVKWSFADLTVARGGTPSPTNRRPTVLWPRVIWFPSILACAASSGPAAMKFFHGTAMGLLGGSHSHSQSTAFLSGFMTSPGSDPKDEQPMRTTNKARTSTSAGGEGSRQHDSPRGDNRWPGRHSGRLLKIGVSEHCDFHDVILLLGGSSDLVVPACEPPVCDRTAKTSSRQRAIVERDAAVKAAARPCTTQAAGGARPSKAGRAKRVGGPGLPT